MDMKLVRIVVVTVRPVVSVFEYNSLREIYIFKKFNLVYYYEGSLFLSLITFHLLQQRVSMGHKMDMKLVPIVVVTVLPVVSVFPYNSLYEIDIFQYYQIQYITMAASSSFMFVNIEFIVATCSDGTQNGYETGTDCGGNCPACRKCI